MEKQLILELAEVILGWNGKVSDVSLRISLQGIINVLKVKGSATVQLKGPPNDIQMHMLIQSGNIAMASVTTRLSTLFQGSKDAFEKLFELNVPGNVVKILVPGTSSAKTVKVRLLGRYSKGNLKEKSKIPAKQVEEEKKSEGNKSIDYELSEEKNKNQEKNFEEYLKKEETKARSEVLTQSNKLNEEEKNQKTQEISRQDLESKCIEEKSIKLTEDTNKPKQFLSLIPLSQSSIQSICPYLKNIKLSYFHYSEISRILTSLKAEMGANFQKFIQEPVRRETKASPVRRLTNTGPSSPKKVETSQISFTSTGKQEDNSIDIPCSVEIGIEKLNIRNSRELI